MKCLNCKKAEMKKVVINDEVVIDGGPTFRVKGITVLRCPKCEDILMDSVTSAERTRRVLSGLIRVYSPQSEKLPGKVALWMRKTMGLSIAEFAKMAGGMDPSTFTYAAQRNSPIDHYAAIVLLARATDFVTGGQAGSSKLRELQELDQLLDPETVDSVQVA